MNNSAKAIAVNAHTGEEVVVYGYQFQTQDNIVITEWAPNAILAARYARGFEMNPYKVIGSAD